MTAPIVLLAQTLKRYRTLLLAMGLLLAGFQIVLVLVARSIHASGGFNQLGAMLPAFARELMGPAFTSMMSFAGIVCVGYFHLSVMASLLAISIAIATTPTSEIESGFIDLILSRPLGRHWIVTRSIILLFLAIAALLAMMLAGTWTGLRVLAPSGAEWPSAHLVASLALNLGLLLLSWSGLAMAIASASRRRAAAGAITGMLALTAFLLDYVGRLWSTADKLAWLSPFRYYNPFDLVMGKPLPYKNLVVLSAIAVAGFIAAYALFARRDIAH